VAIVAGGHHGLPPSDTQILTLEEGSYNSDCGFGENMWKQAQDALVEQALVQSKLSRDSATSITLTREAQALLSGLVIMADWIASDTEKMPLIPIEEHKVDSYERALEALDTLELPSPWDPDWDLEHIYQRRFSNKGKRPLQPRPIQEALINAVASCHKPGIFVVEAPMGEGKTEAALAAAELLANHKGCRGIYFALPSQATSNAMFTRVINWIKEFEHNGEQLSVRLIHGRAELNELQSALRLSSGVKLNDEEEKDASLVVHEWLSGRKKGILSDFAVGTIDHVLMAALRQKHLVLRHLGLASKVVIIDECHAYDVYMESYLLMALRWLGAYGVPVIVLSATLPSSRRRSVIEAYLNAKAKRDPVASLWVKKGTESKPQKPDDCTLPTYVNTKAYPLITYTDGGEVRHLEVQGAAREMKVKFHRLDDEQVVSTLKTVLSEGGIAGIIVNTIKRAQDMYSLLSEAFGENVCLLHSQFLASERAKLEETLVDTLGPDDKRTERPKKLIVVGTQIFEQSMDIDFDVMITDLCPIDLLLQRVGRLHRHVRARPLPLVNAVCFVMSAEWGNFDRGSEWIYGRYLLMRTRAAMPDHAVLPADIPRLVAEVYDDSKEANIPAEMIEVFEAAKEKCAQDTQKLVNRAKAYQVSSPYLKSPLIGWLDTAASEAQGDAAVRDGADSLEVIVVQRKGEELFFLPCIERGQVLPTTTPDNKLARKLLGCSIRLPAIFGEEWMIDNVIKELEEVMVTEGLTKGWYQSHWLKGMLVMILDENQEITLCGYRLRYDEEFGLCMSALS